MEIFPIKSGFNFFVDFKNESKFESSESIFLLKLIFFFEDFNLNLFSFEINSLIVYLLLKIGRFCSEEDKLIVFIFGEFLLNLSFSLFKYFSCKIGGIIYFLGLSFINLILFSYVDFLSVEKAIEF